jgi:glucose dehydrogenase
MTTTLRQRLACSLVFAGMLMGQSIAVRSAAPGMEDPNDWPQYHRTYNAWRYSPLDQINRDNVKPLKVAWIFEPARPSNRSEGVRQRSARTRRRRSDAAQALP